MKMGEIKFRYVLKVYNTSRDDPAYYEWLELPIFTLSELEHNGLDKWILKNVGGIIETIAKNQYTGYKDKNGKGIYEGDFISWKLWSHIDPQFATVEFKDGGFCPFPELSRPNYTTEQTYEVLGNIYENPELLKETK